MGISGVRALCVALPGATAEYSFGPQPLVFKVGGKIFAIVSEDKEPPRISLKCDPELAPMLRESYAAVTPGYHLNKRHWNTVDLDDSVPADELAAWIEDSYDLVVAGLPSAARSVLTS